LVIFFIILAASFAPFSGWKWPTVPILEFVSYPLPHYVSLVDNFLNILIYILYAAVLSRLVRSVKWAWIWVLLVVCFTSFFVEVIQNFLPNRIASNLDILCNVMGGLLGLIFYHLNVLKYPVRWVRAYQAEHFVEVTSADYAMILILLWFVFQSDPVLPWFGLVFLPEGDDMPLLENLVQNSVVYFSVLEALGAFFNLLSILLFLICFLKNKAGQFRAFLLILCGVVAVKLGVALIFYGFGSELKQEWVSDNASVGGCLALLMAWALRSLPFYVQAVLAEFSFFGLLFVQRHWPFVLSAKENLTRLRLSGSHFETLYAGLNGLQIIWPWCAALCLMSYGFKRAWIYLDSEKLT
ncbi:MAG: VanZ family protein, partial [Neisseriaceae bacterium]|nr:VanZ family protein [Neisseriaceae bacterium]